MSSDEQDRTSGSVPNAFGNALAWKWTRQMPTAVRRSGLPTLLYAARAMANAAGELRFNGDRKPIRIQDIARAACCDEKDARRYMEAAIRAGVVTVRGERRRGVPTLYVLLPSPFPDWKAAAEYLGATKRERPGRKSGPWTESEVRGASPELEGPEFGGPPPELTDGTETEVPGTAPCWSSGDRPRNGSGDRPRNNPGVTHDSSHDGAEVVPQPQVDGTSGPEDPSPQEQPDRSADTASSTGSLTRCRECDIPLIRPDRGDLCHGCHTYLETRNTA